MTQFERLGEKCTNTICHKECPIWYFNHNGAGKGTGNNCMESLRFPNVTRAMKLFLAGKPWDKSTLHDFGEDD